MTTEIYMSCNVLEKRDFAFLVTSHEEQTGHLTIHGNELGCSIRCSVEQATDLITELEAAITRIAHYKEKGE